MDPKTTAEVLGEAWDAAENEIEEQDDGSQEGLDEVAADDGSEPATEDSAVADDGTDREEGGQEESGELQEEKDEEGVRPASEEEGESADPGDKPPVSLSAAAREVWKETPKAMREEIAKRERDFAVGIQRHAENAKRAVEMDRALAPYQQYFAMNGGPQQAIGAALQTGALLQSGTPNQKAQLVAGLIQQFGVDINTLDSMLAGQPVEQGSPPSADVQSQIDQAIAPYKQMMAEIQQGRQQQTQQQQQQLQSELDAFAQDPEHEFYTDLRIDMADILDLYAARGQDLTLKEAYTKALALRPDLQQIVEARKTRETTQGKKVAAASISGRRGAEPSSAGPETVRDALAQAWDNFDRM